MISPVLDSLIDPFGASAADIGLMISFFTAPGIVMYLVAGLLADRYGRKPVLVGSLLLFGAAGTAIAFTTNYQLVLLLRLLQGVAFGGITPIIITSLGDMYVGDKEATAQGVRFTGSGITSTVFPLLAGFLVVIAWQYPFLIYAIAIPIALLLAVWFTEPTDLDAEELVNDDSRTTRDQLDSLWALVTQTRVFAMVIARGLPMVIWIGFITYNSLIVVQVHGGTPGQAGILVAVGSIMYAGAASQAGRITSIFDSRLYPLIGANGCLGIGFAIFLFAPILVVAAVGIGIVGIGFGLTLSLYRSIITGLAPEELRAGLVTIAESLGRVSATVTPIAMGAVIAVMQPIVGLGPAIQLVGIGCAVVGAVGGVVCLLVMSSSATVQYEERHTNS